MTLVRVTRKSDVALAMRTIHDRFRNEGEAVGTTIGFPGGSVPETVFWRADAGVWLGLHKEWSVTRHWSAYGIVPPAHNVSVPIAVEINPPIEGINKRIAGFIATDGTDRYLCHTGRLGGGREGINRRAFVAWRGDSRVAVSDGDGRTTSAFVVAGIDSTEFMAQIADFVKLVARFKNGDAPPVEVTEDAPVFKPEFAGSKIIPASPEIIAVVNHGVVVNRLAEELRQMGLSPLRTQTRDLFLGPPKSPNAHFEVKASCDTQSLYTAIGQLCLLNVNTPTTRRVLVAPTPHPPHLKPALTVLNIGLIGYEWNGQQPTFPGLQEFLNGIKQVARK